MTQPPRRLFLVQVSVVGLFLLAVMYTAFLGRALVVPILVAVLLNYLLSPVVRWLAKRRVPRPVSAAVLLLALTGVVGGATLALAMPAAEWMSRAPQAVAKAKDRFESLRVRLRKAQDVAAQIEEATDLEQKDDSSKVAVVAGPSLGARVFGSTTALLGAALTVFFLTFLLLAPGDAFQAKLLEVLQTKEERATARTISLEAEQQMSRFMVTVTLVNLGVAVVTAGLTAVLGLPNPLLWGVVAGLLNFVPYIGAVMTVAVLFLASLMTFDSLGRVLAAPLAFAVVNLIEANLVTPKVQERWLSLNAVVGFVGVLFFWTILGWPGALLAVPILVVFKILCDHVESLKTIGAFLGK
jgi:predicted PurR-regulated permease PerM